MSYRTIFFAGVVLVCASLAIAQAPSIAAFQHKIPLSDSTYNVDVLSEFSWNRVFDVAIAGDYAYCATNYGLLILDVSDPIHPAFAASLKLPVGWAAYGVDVADYLAYVVADNGLYIIDVSDPQSPFLVNQFGLVGRSYAVQVVGDLAYVAGSGLQIVNVADPSAPFIEGGYSTGVNALDMEVVGDYVFLATEDSELYKGSLWIVNITDPGNPYLVSRLDTQHGLGGVAVEGDYAYLLQFGAPGLLVINIAYLPTPVQVGSYYVSGNDIEIVDTLVFVAGDRFAILSVADPLHPQQLSLTETPGKPWGVTVGNGLAYIADLDAGLQIYSVVDPTVPDHMGGYIAPAQANDVDVIGDYAYVAGTGLKSIKVKYYYDPYIAGETNDHFPGTAQHVVVEFPYAYVATSDSSVEIIFVGDPSNPYLAGSVKSFGPITDLAVRDGYICIADFDSGLVIADATDPAHTSVVGKLMPWPAGVRSAVAISGGYAYLAGPDLQVINFSDPAAPYIAGYAVLSGTSNDADIYGNRLYIASAHEDVSRGSLHVVDITFPNNPISRGSLSLPTSALSIECDSIYAYVGDSTGLTVVNVSNPIDLRRAGRYASLSPIYGLALANGLIYAADSYKLVFLQFEEHLCGDVNGDGIVNVGDAVYIIAYIFAGGPPPHNICNGDVSGNGRVDIGDPVYLINFVFKGGPPPVETCCPL